MYTFKGHLWHLNISLIFLIWQVVSTNQRLCWRIHSSSQCLWSDCCGHREGCTGCWKGNDSCKQRKWPGECVLKSTGHSSSIWIQWFSGEKQNIFRKLSIKGLVVFADKTATNMTKGCDHVNICCKVNTRANICVSPTYWSLCFNIWKESKRIWVNLDAKYKIPPFYLFCRWAIQSLLTSLRCYPKKEVCPWIRAVCFPG